MRCEESTRVAAFWADSRERVRELGAAGHTGRERVGRRGESSGTTESREGGAAGKVAFLGCCFGGSTPHALCAAVLYFVRGYGMATARERYV